MVFVNLYRPAAAAGPCCTCWARGTSSTCLAGDQAAEHHCSWCRSDAPSSLLCGHGGYAGSQLHPVRQEAAARSRDSQSMWGLIKETIENLKVDIFKGNLI